MDNSLVVRICERVGDRDKARHECQAIFPGRQRRELFLQRPTGYELHGEEGLPGAPAACFIQRDNRRVLEARRDRELAHEAPRRALPTPEQYLDGDAATLTIGREQDAAHSPAGEFSLYDVVDLVDEPQGSQESERVRLRRRCRAARISLQRVHVRARDGHDTSARAAARQMLL